MFVGWVGVLFGIVIPLSAAGGLLQRAGLALPVADDPASIERHRAAVKPRSRA